MAVLILDSSTPSTGITYHEDMTKHYCLWDPDYPECPERYFETLKRCKELNLLSRCKIIPTRMANKEEILSKHSENLMTLLRKCENKPETELEETSSHYDSIYICPDTYKSALLAAGSTINLVEAICEGNIRNGMAIIRPPGHHAMKSTYCGYCFFNNVALAAHFALEKYNFSRIMIIDWDVHHGQATQQMFYDNKRVLYFSIHRFEYGTFWPNLAESDFNYVGENEGKGYNFNVPLNKTGLGNAEYLSIFHQILLPVAVEYEPQLIIISAGYDSALGCPEGEMKVTPACYAHFIKSLSCLAGGKIAVVLEGGYFLKSLAEGAAMTLRALLGDPCPKLEMIEKIDDKVHETILNVMYSHRNFWQCFKAYDQFTLHDAEAQNYYPTIKFNYNEEYPSIFPTRNCYPTRNQKEIDYFLERLQNLIVDTNLHVPKYKCVLYSDVNLINDITTLWDDVKVTSLRNFENGGDLLSGSLSAVNYILNNDSSSVIIKKVVQNKGSDVLNNEDMIINYVINKSNMKRILLVDFHSEVDYSSVQMKNDLHVLYYGFKSLHSTTNISNYELDILVDQEHFKSYLCNFNNKIISDIEYITIWLKFCLPVFYQFNPDVVLVFVNLKNNFHNESFGYLIHWLTTLANGKMLVVADFDVENECSKFAFTRCIKPLIGIPLPILNLTNLNFEYVFKFLKNACKDVEKQWSNLNFFVKFLNENV